MESLKQPKIDIKEIQEKANAAARKAYLDEVEQYYTSYNSPYKKMIKNELEKQEFKYNMELPNILEKINDALKDEVDAIANNAIAMSYIPMVNDALGTLPKNLKISEFLKMIIEEEDQDRDLFSDYAFSYKKHERHDWLDCEIITPESVYEFTLHAKNYYRSEKHEGEQQYQCLGFPNNKSKSKMTIYKDDVKIEMPFTPNILSDKVLGLFFKMMIGSSLLTMDVSSFHEDMFPEDEDHCHC